MNTKFLELLDAQCMMLHELFDGCVKDCHGIGLITHIIGLCILETYPFDGETKVEIASSHHASESWVIIDHGESREIKMHNQDIALLMWHINDGQFGEMYYTELENLADVIQNMWEVYVAG